MKVLKRKRRVIQLFSALLTISLVTPQTAKADEAIVYMSAVAPGVSLSVIGTSGDAIGSGYLLGGIPDGLGVIKDGNRLRIITNHEWSNALPTAAARTSTQGMTSGSYISELHLDLKSKKLVEGKDFMQWIDWFDYATQKFGAIPTAPPGAADKDSYGSVNHSYLINRFCSSTLAPAGLFYDAKSGTGYKGAVYLTGEEGGDESRGFVGNQDGEMAQIPRFGLSAWETFVPAPTNSKSTVVFGNEDGSATDSQVWMYMGTKSKTGEWYEKAGFTNGKTYVLATDVANDNEFRAKYGKTGSAPVSFKEIDWTQNGKLQNEQARAVGMELARVEDGHFDPKRPNDYYFLTTESNKDPKATAANPALPTTSRDGGALWRLRLKDVNNPLKGGTLTMLLDGSEEPYLSKPDNMSIDNLGNVLIQEDPGNNALRARVISYRLSDGKLAVVTQFKSQYFDPTSASLITQDEESSGIIDVTEYFKTSKSDKARYYMYVAQVHASVTKSRPDLISGADQAAIEGGQWYLMKVDNWGNIYS